MATKPWKTNSWSFRTDVMCNASTMAFNPGDPYPPPTAPVSPPRKRVPLIFQRLEDTKQENALRCHADACQKYLESKDNVKLQCGKSDQELMMHNCHLYRTHLENAELLARARGVEDCHSGEQVWAMSLREHWTVEPRIGDLYATPIYYEREGYKKDIEQIGSPYEENLHHIISDSSSPRSAKQLRTLTLYKRFLKQCEKKIAKVKTHVPDFRTLEVVGTRLPESFITRANEETKSCNSEVVMTEAVTSEAGKCGWDVPEHGPRAELSTTNLFLHGKPGEHASSLVTLHNTGSTSLLYQWQKQPPISLLVDEDHTSKCIAQAGNAYPRRASCFHIVPIAGCLVPGERKDFHIEFHPRFAGSFMETWVLCFSPKLSTSLQALHLHGAAAITEDENIILERKLLGQRLAVGERTHCLEEIFCEIVDRAIKQVKIVFKKAPEFVMSDEAFEFMRRNVEVFDETPLYYNLSVSRQFEAIAAEIHSKTQSNKERDVSMSEIDTMGASDLSVPSLVLCLDGIYGHESWKEMMRQRMSSLHLLAAIPPHPTALLHTSLYKALQVVVTDIEEVMEGIRPSVSTTESDQIDTDLMETLMSDPFKRQNNSLKIAGKVGQQADSLKNMGNSPSKQALLKAGQVPSLTSTSSKQAFMSVKDGGVAEKSDNGVPKQGHGAGEMKERIAQCEGKVRKLLQEGLVENLVNNIESALAKLAPVVRKKVKCYSDEGDEVTASWLSLWFARLSEALAQ